MMKKTKILALAILTMGCNQKEQILIQNYIEPSSYSVMSYQVKDTSYHKDAQQLLTEKVHVTVEGDSIFNVSKKLGNSLFYGEQFTYKILNDSLYLRNGKNKKSYKLVELLPNSFSIEMNTKYINRLDLVKPLHMRRRIEHEIELEY